MVPFPNIMLSKGVEQIGFTHILDRSKRTGRTGQQSSAVPCFAGALAQRSKANNGWGVDGSAGGNNVRVYGRPGGRRAVGAQNRALHSRSGAVESRWGSFGEGAPALFAGAAGLGGRCGYVAPAPAPDALLARGDQLNHPPARPAAAMPTAAQGSHSSWTAGSSRNAPLARCRRPR